jgi:hypothetical protein
LARANTSVPATPGLASSAAYDGTASIRPLDSHFQIGSGVPQ